MRPDGAQRAWCSPGRIDLIGHTDFCLSLAMAPGCLVTVSMLDEQVLELAGEDPVELAQADLAPGLFPAGWRASTAGVVWAFGQRGVGLPGLSISVQAGPRADPALACAVAIADLCQLELDDSEKLAVALRARREFAGEVASGADELVALFAQDGHLALCSSGTDSLEAIAFDLEPVGLALLAVDCHAPGDLLRQGGECAEAARGLGIATLAELTLDDLDDALGALTSETLRSRARHIVTEHDRTQACAELLRAGHIRDVGPLLTASGESLRADFGVGGVEAELAVAVMFAFNAFGARVTGDGWAVGLLTPYQARACEVGIRSAFSGRGYAEPTSHTVTPTGGLARV